MLRLKPSSLLSLTLGHTRISIISVIFESLFITMQTIAFLAVAIPGNPKVPFTLSSVS